MGMNGASLHFPLYYYEDAKPSFGQGSLFGEESNLVRRDGITDFIIKRARESYGDDVTKEDIFYYVYGILHSPSYGKKFADDLKMFLPRLPLVRDEKKFWAFSAAGRELARLHLDYESVEPYPGVEVRGPANGDYSVTRMHFAKEDKKERKDRIVFSDSIEVSNIPPRAYDYVINGRSAIEWVMERYQTKTDPASGIANDPNDWGREHENPRYVLGLLLSVISVSMKTLDIVDSLPDVDWDNE